MSYNVPASPELLRQTPGEGDTSLTLTPVREVRESEAVKRDSTSKQAFYDQSFKHQEFRCDYCDYINNSNDILKEHMKKHKNHRTRFPPQLPRNSSPMHSFRPFGFLLFLCDTTLLSYIENNSIICILNPLGHVGENIPTYLPPNMWGVELYDHVLIAELAKQSKLILSDLTVFLNKDFSVSDVLLWAKYEPIWQNFTGKTVIFSAY